MKIIRVALADDHQLVLEGLAAILEHTEGIEVAGTAANGSDFLTLLESTPIDVAVVDIEMPVLNGIEATRTIREKGIPTRVLGLSMYNESSLIKEMIAAGAKGYVLKNTSRAEMIAAITTLSEGNYYYGTGIFDPQAPIKGYMTVGEKPDIDCLTRREKEILVFLAEGLSLNDISDRLCISPRTVDTHRSNIMKKLNVNSTARLIRAAYKSGLCS